MQRQFVAGAGPQGVNTPAETYAMLQKATERVERGEPTFRIGEFVGLKLTPAEWAPINGAVREDAGRCLKGGEGVGRPSGSLRRCLKGAPTPKPRRAVAFSDVVETRTSHSHKGQKRLRLAARLSAHVSYIARRFTPGPNEARVCLSGVGRPNSAGIPSRFPGLVISQRDLHARG